MSGVGDPYNLQRFAEAQQSEYRQVCAELTAGRKRGHWIWFIFPQLKGLGRSATAVHFGIGSLPEAQAYLAHPVLGPRLRECCRLLAAIRARPIQAIVGSPDDLKVRSSMTLFRAAAGEPESAAEFQAVLDAFYGGEADAATLGLLSAGRGSPTHAGERRRGPGPPAAAPRCRPGLPPAVR